MPDITPPSVHSSYRATRVRKRRPNALVSLVAWCILLCALLGIFLKLTIQDSIRLVHVYYYMTPPTVIFISLLVTTGLFKINRQPRATKVVGILTLISALWWVGSEWRFHPQRQVATSDGTGSANADQIKFVFWNVARRDNQVNTFRRLREMKADVIGLVELEGNRDERREQLNAMFPEYNISVLGSYMYLLVKGTSTDAVPVQLAERTASVARCVDVIVRNQKFSVILVDIDADLRKSREAALVNLDDLADSYTENPVIVMGDFNTSMDSLFLKPFFHKYKEAFLTAGFGFTPTWPSFFPMLQLDQIWVSKELDILSAKRHWHFRESDHAAVEAVISVPHTLEK